MENDFGAVVVDNGSGYLKAGFAGENEPRLVFVPEVGRPRPHEAFSVHRKQVLVGLEVRSGREHLTIQAPIQHGVVVNWPDMERLWDNVFNQELQVDPTCNRVLLSEPPLNPRANRIRTVETMFEYFRFAGTFLACQSVMALFAAGRTTGLCLDCGYQVTHWVPVVEGYPLPQGIARLGYGGRDLDEHLGRLLSERGYFLSVDRDGDALRKMKETLCYVVPDNEEEEFLRTGQGQHHDTFVLPNGTSILLAQERYRCPEALFRPAAMGLKSVGVGEAARLAVDNCHNKTLQHQMYEAVVITGGTTHLKGFKQRLRAEVTAGATAVDPNAQVRVIAPPNRKYATWIGGAIMASLATFEPLWIRRDEYEEHGSSIVLRKCF